MGMYHLSSLSSKDLRSSSKTAPPSSPGRTAATAPQLLPALDFAPPRVVPLSDSSNSTRGWSPTDDDDDDWNEAKQVQLLAGAQQQGRSRAGSDAEGGGGGGGGGGIGGFFRRRMRSTSRSRKTNDKVELSSTKVVPPPPPVPALPTFARALTKSPGSGREPTIASFGGSGYGGGDMGESVMGDMTFGMTGMDQETTTKRTAQDEDDLASLLYLVQAAGDKFATEPTSSSIWPSPSLALSPPQTPPLHGSSTSFSSPDTPSSSYIGPTTPKPHYSFLSHIANGNTSAYRPPPTPPPVSPRAKKVESDDEYGSEGEDHAWSKTPASKFRSASVDKRSAPPAPRQRAIDPSQRPRRRRALGPKASALLNHTLFRLAPPANIAVPVSTLHHPISTNSHSVVIKANRRRGSMAIVLGQAAIATKLQRGLTMLEAMELESPKSRTSIDSQSSASTSSDDGTASQASFSLVQALNPFVSNIQPTRATPRQPPTNTTSSSRTTTSLAPLSRQPASEHLCPAHLRTWLDRKPFSESHLLTIAVEGGEMVDLVRPRLSQAPLVVSPRVCSIVAQITPSSLPSSKLTTLRSSHSSAPPVASSRHIPSTSPSRHRNSTLPPPPPRNSTITGKKPLLPGPLLLKALSTQSQLQRPRITTSSSSSDEEEDLPLAVLRARASSSNPSSPSTAETMALRQAKERTEKLEAEVMRLKRREVERDLREVKEREEREVERKREERERRVAEGRRRSRAMMGVGKGAVTDDEGEKEKVRRRMSKRTSTTMPIMMGQQHQHPMLRSASSPVPTIGGVQPWGPAQPPILVVPNPFAAGVGGGWPLLAPPNPYFYNSPRHSTSAPDLQALAFTVAAFPPQPPQSPLPHRSPTPNTASRRQSTNPRLSVQPALPPHHSLPPSPTSPNFQTTTNKTSRRVSFSPAALASQPRPSNARDSLLPPGAGRPISLGMSRSQSSPVGMLGGASTGEQFLKVEGRRLSVRVGAGEVRGPLVRL